MFVLEGVTTTESGLKYCVHNSGWSVQYGWSTGSEGWVASTGAAVSLGECSGATGTIGLSAGTYDITFNLNDLTIQFDISAEEEEETDWYIAGGFNTDESDNWLLSDGYKFTQSEDDEDVFVLNNFVVTADDLDDYGGLSFSIATPEWAETYVCNENIYSFDTEYDFVLSTEEGAWSSAYCNALTAGCAYTLTWNRSDKKLSIEEKSIAFTTYADGHATVTDNTYLRGGDISRLTYVEDLGAKFYDADGNEKDALDIMQENGVNFVRLRLYNNPGQTVTYGGTTYKMPEGYLDEDDVLALAKRAKAHNMKIQLTFHYSDFWTNGLCQFKPSGWEDYTFEELETAVYDYTKQFLQKMVVQGTTPEYVSLGNEIQNGMLLGYNSDSARDAVNGYSHANLAALMNQGSVAVREVCPDSKIIIHLTMNSSWKTAAKFVSFFNDMEDNSLDYDIIGLSYYPYYTENTPSFLSDIATTLYSNFSKDMMIMEVGYSWTQYKPSGRNGGDYEGQLHLNGDIYNEATEAGQKSFMQEVNTVVKGNDHILGYLYWDPVFVDQKVSGSWINTYDQLHLYSSTWYGDYNTVSNTTWFDYDGNALSVFEAIAEDAPDVPSTVTIDGTTYTVEQQEPYTLSIGETGYATFYDAVAREIPDGMTAYTVESVSNSQISPVSLESDNIPAETGVMVQGNAGTYYLWPRWDDASSVNGNMLYGTVLSQTITTPTGDYLYYGLSNGSNGLGWYWREDGGAAFTNGAHKAYLAIPSGSLARSFISMFDDETAITTLAAEDESLISPNGGDLEGATVYDLTGRRVSQPLRGRIYIANGKKIYIR